MTQESKPRIARELLDDGTDVSAETSRALIIRACNIGLRADARVEAIEHKLSLMAAGLKIDLADKEHRLRLVERRPSAPKFDPDSSYNELTATMREATDTLYARAKDPRDRLDSERARAIAKEVVETTKNADDAQAFRAWRGRRWSVLLKVVEVLIAAAVGALAAHYGLK